MANVISSRDKTFQDEYQLPDLILQPSEVAAVKRAAHKLGFPPLTRTPTGRTCQMILRQALDRCLYEEAMATSPRKKAEWRSAAVRAKFALGQKSFND